jgi:uncharacterized membrane protein
MQLHLFAIVVLGLMTGSELNVALFAHPILNRQPQQTHILVRASLAALLGRVMPFWMACSTLLNLLLLLPIEHLGTTSWRLAAISFGMQVFAVVFSLVGPVPINNRILKWTPDSLPNDWKQQEQRWDVYHAVRTGALCVAFVLLTLSFRLN